MASNYFQTVKNMKYFITIQTTINKSQGLRSWTFSLRNFCLTGTVFAVMIGLLCTSYLRLSLDVINVPLPRQIIDTDENNYTSVAGVPATSSDNKNDSEHNGTLPESQEVGKERSSFEFLLKESAFAGNSSAKAHDNLREDTALKKSEQEPSIRAVSQSHSLESERTTHMSNSSRELHTRASDGNFLRQEGRSKERRRIENDQPSKEKIQYHMEENAKPTECSKGEKSDLKLRMPSSEIHGELQNRTRYNSKPEKGLDVQLELPANPSDGEAISVPAAIAPPADEGTLVLNHSGSRLAPDRITLTIPVRSRANLTITQSPVPKQLPQGGLCNIFDGQWIPDATGPLYTSDSCPYITQAQNCQKNGRPDKAYEFYKWQPNDCAIPRLEPLKFLDVMKNKKLAFVGDSVARNQMESLLCILLQGGEATNRGNKDMQRWYFPSHNFSLIRLWSGWLVRQSSEPFPGVPDDAVKLYLSDLGVFSKYMSTFDVTVISSGHWWARKSAYIVDGKVIGGIGWSLPKFKEYVKPLEAYGMAMKNVLGLIREFPGYNGLTVFRTYSPDHYEGGHWDTGGSCTDKTTPYTKDQVPVNSFGESMRSKQLNAYDSTTQPINGSGLRLLDVYPVFRYRHDGHPGPYRSLDPNKKTQRDAKGRPPPQDCLHWCMPGPVDTMNQLLFEVVKQEVQ